MIASRFTLGDRVEVLAFRRWRPGRVMALRRVRVTVEYSTREGIVRRLGDFSPGRVRPAAIRAEG